MPNVNWTDILSYDGNETFNNIPSYRYSNASIMNVIYWMNIETCLPLGWSNVPNATVNPSPIIQYFYAAVEYDAPLSADYFKLPPACTNAPICPIIDHATTRDDDTIAGGTQSDSCDESEFEAAKVVILMIVFIVDAGGGILSGKHMYKRKLNVTRVSSRGNINVDPEIELMNPLSGNSNSHEA